MALGLMWPEGAPEGMGPDLEAQQASWSRVHGGNAQSASPDSLVPEGLRHPPLLLPPMPLGCTRPEGAPEDGRPGPGAQQPSWGPSGLGKYWVHSPLIL